jgi:hypothetical protein
VSVVELILGEMSGHEMVRTLSGRSQHNQVVSKGKHYQAMEQTAILAGSKYREKKN